MNLYLHGLIYGYKPDFATSSIASGTIKFDFSNLRFDTLAMQMLQVCNFNFILMPLMLFKKNEFARQYSVFFSMFAASTAHTSVSSSFVNLNW